MYLVKEKSIKPMFFLSICLVFWKIKPFFVLNSYLCLDVINRAEERGRNPQSPVVLHQISKPIVVSQNVTECQLC